METQAQGRTVRPDAEAIKRLRLEKGWRAEDLARKALCSQKTIENVERGANVYMFTLAKVAKALGVAYQTLLPVPTPTSEPQPQQRRIDVQITLSIPFQEFDESEQLVSFIELLKRLLPARDEIHVKAVTEGSVLITLELSAEDATNLLLAYERGHLVDLKVADVKVLLEPLEGPPQQTVNDRITRARHLLRYRELLKELTQLAESKLHVDTDADETP